MWFCFTERLPRRTAALVASASQHCFKHSSGKLRCHGSTDDAGSRPLQHYESGGGRAVAAPPWLPPGVFAGPFESSHSHPQVVFVVSVVVVIVDDVMDEARLGKEGDRR